MRYAEVCVNAPVAQRRTFSYEIPSGLSIEIGQAVRVPFGEKILQGIVVELTNLHPERPTLGLKLPQEWPMARLELEPGKMTDLQPHLNAVLLRPDDLEAMMIWCARTERTREYMPQQYSDMKTDVAWRLSK